MTAGAAFVDGWRRVLRGKVLAAGVWGGSLLVALPLALVLHGEIAAHLGNSAVAERALDTVDFDWWNEFRGAAGELGQTLVPSIIGFAAVLRNVTAVAEGHVPGRLVALAVIAYLALSLFLMGGVLDRLARDRPVGAHAFFGACGLYFGRFVRLGVVAALAYIAIFGWLQPWLLESLYPRLTREVTEERVAFAWRIAMYVAFAVPLVLTNLVLDYAKIRMVVEDRRSAIGALAGALRFVRRHPAAVAMVYLLNALMFLLVIAVYFALAPGAGRGVAGAFASFAGAQIYVLARVLTRLAFAASQIALFQSRLAHAAYVARPVPRWPDSPTAAALVESP
jgi:hypothetical protein